MTSASSISKPASSDAVRQGVVADGAVDVGDGAAGAADEVVVVVADPRLVAGHRAGRLDAPDQPGVGERAQHVVDGLVRHLAERRARTAPMIESVSACGCVVHRGEHREPRARHPQGGRRAACAASSVVVGITPSLAHNLEQFKSGSGASSRRLGGGMIGS